MHYNIPKLIQFKTLKKTFFKFFYNFTATISYLRNVDLPFMNLGYVGETNIKLKEKDEKNRNYIQLYHYITKDTVFNDKYILEVGCGRGGGCYYFTEYLKARNVVGIDISTVNIKICKKHFNYPNLSFIQGDAEKFSFIENTFDVVINLESSHAYPKRQFFFNNVKKVLKPNGTFLYADIFADEIIDKIDSLLLQAGFNIIKKEDITNNILKSIDTEDTTEKYPFISKHKFLQFELIKSIAVFKDSDTYNCFKEGKLKYIYYTLSHI